MKKIWLLVFPLLLTACAHAGQNVRVQLADGLTSAQIQTSGKIYIYATNGGKKYKVSKPEMVTVKLANGKLSASTLTTTAPLVIEPTEQVQLTFQKNTYTGKLYIIPSGKTFSVVEHIDMENYLLGVLPYEMNYTWPLEALKTQAVAARTYTQMQLKGDKAVFDLYNDTRSQM